MANPAACSLTWLPESLYKSAISAVGGGYNRLKSGIRDLPADVQFDVYEKLFRDGTFCVVGYELCNLEIFLTVLSVQNKRYELHQIFQALIDHGLRLCKLLADDFCQRCNYVGSEICGLRDARQHMYLITNGLTFGSFLIEAGWYEEGAKCVESVLELCKLCSDQSSLRIQRWIIEGYVWLLEAYNGNCRYEDGKRTIRHLLVYTDRLKERSAGVCFAELHTQFSSFFYNIGKYEESYQWGLKALRELYDAERPHDWTPAIKSVIRVFSQISKILVVRRQFRRAELLIKCAVSLMYRHYERGKRYPSPLLDYGFYLMNVDMNDASAQVTQLALDYRQAQFGGRNLKLAHAHEDLAYALYVMEYSTGHFTKAKDHAERAIGILKSLLPHNHLLLASCQRVKALILEEIAIDSQDKSYEAQLLQEAEDLHLDALSICKRLFGENNIQTAKHYGNLGRLYQSLRRYEEAEHMHLKAVRIKERLLGSEDYEVALSIGHLASLYGYDMDRHDEAERLYLRSIEIGKRLFGEAYSGLEYDYRGLIHIYVQRHDRDRAGHYVNALHRWKMIRDTETNRVNPLSIMNDQQEPSEFENPQWVLEQFFKKDL